MNLLRKLTVAIIAMSSLSAAHADLVAISGNTSLISPPPSVLLGDLRDDTNAFVFEEKKGVVYPGFDALVTSQEAIDRNLDWLSQYFVESTPPDPNMLTFHFFTHTQPGFFYDHADVVPDSPANGTRLDSYFLHFEPTPFDPRSEALTATGTLFFDEEILGVQFSPYYPSPLELAASLVELEGTDYVRGTRMPPQYVNDGALEIWPSDPYLPHLNDNFEIASDRKSISFSFSANGLSDQIRIITASTRPVPVPEPSTLALLGLGLAGMGLATRRKSANGITT